MKLTLLALTLAVGVSVGCGSSEPSGGTGTGGTGGPAMYTLTVQNYLSWCDVTENGALYAASAPPAMSFPAGTVVDLTAVPNTIFVWGYWTGTDGDTSAGHDMSMSTTVKMDGDKTVMACCPDPPPAAPTCP